MNKAAVFVPRLFVQDFMAQYNDVFLIGVVDIVVNLHIFHVNVTGIKVSALECFVIFSHLQVL